MWERTLGMVVLAAVAAAAAQAGDKQMVRGRYLVESVGMCGDCHTPRGPMGQPDLTRPLGGASIDFKATVPVPDWADMAPAIAGPQARGWTRVQMVHFLKTGERPDGSLSRPPMPMVRMTQEDAEAVATYLASLPAPVAAIRTKAAGAP